ncbi:unnamed protein product [Notodromas monacha]|uniref:Uncharacterized protein n=1 Tax=Notodromas monacha TaxID=399045 RepID=A0A7R9BLK7_9CRUS|nr:unnamed protein product [Notodromas monacha]CAG0917728.1 unnamed protein product [Notodromas monacha]
MSSSNTAAENILIGNKMRKEEPNDSAGHEQLDNSLPAIINFIKAKLETPCSKTQSFTSAMPISTLTPITAPYPYILAAKGVNRVSKAAQNIGSCASMTHLPKLLPMCATKRAQKGTECKLWRTFCFFPEEEPNDSAGHEQLDNSLPAIINFIKAKLETPCSKTQSFTSAMPISTLTPITAPYPYILAAKGVNRVSKAAQNNGYPSTLLAPINSAQEEHVEATLKKLLNPRISIPIFFLLAFVKFSRKNHEESSELEKCLSVFDGNAGNLNKDDEWQPSQCELKAFSYPNRYVERYSCLEKRKENQLSNKFFFFGDSTVNQKAVALAKFFNLTLVNAEKCLDDDGNNMTMHWENKTLSASIQYQLNPFLNPYVQIPKGADTVLFGGATWYARLPTHHSFDKMKERYFDLKHLPIAKKLEIHKGRLDRLLHELTTFWKIKTIIWIQPGPITGDFLRQNKHVDAYIKQSLEVLSKYQEKVIIWSSWRTFYNHLLATKGLRNIIPDGIHVQEKYQLPGMQTLLNFLCNPDKCLSVFQSNGSLNNNLSWELSQCKLKIYPILDQESCLKQRQTQKLNNTFFFFGDSTVRAKAIALAKFFNLTLISAEKCLDFGSNMAMHWENKALSSTIHYLLNPYFNPYVQIPQGTETVLFGGAVWFARPPNSFSRMKERYFDLKHLQVPNRLEIQKQRLDRLLHQLTNYWKIRTIIWILPEPTTGKLANVNKNVDAYIKQSMEVLSKYKDKVIIWSSWRMFYDQLETKGLGNIMPDEIHVQEKYQLPGMQTLLNFLCNPA